MVMSEPTRGPGCLDPDGAASMINAPAEVLVEAVAYGELYDKPWILVYRGCSGGCLLYGGLYRLCLGAFGVYGVEFIGHAYLCPCSIVSGVDVERVVAVHSLGGVCFVVLDDRLEDVCSGEDRFSWYYFASTSIEELADEMLRRGVEVLGAGMGEDAGAGRGS